MTDVTLFQKLASSPLASLYWDIADTYQFYISGTLSGQGAAGVFWVNPWSVNIVDLQS